MTDHPHAVGVYPPDSLETHARLFHALSCALPVSFVPLGDGLTVDAIVSFAGPDAVSGLNTPGKPCFAAAPAGEESAGTEIAFSNDDALDFRLRGRTFAPETKLARGAIGSIPGDRVLATAENSPCWIQRDVDNASVDVVAIPIPELDADEVLRDCLSPGRCMALLPLVHFLRSISRDADWQPPPLRATLMIDDPNLHAMSYGFIDFASLVEHATTHNYHLSSATIPLDGWYVNNRAARFFRDHTDRISLLVHGNNHSRHELAQPYSEVDSLALAGQALRRIAKFESRSGLRVARVMAAPHGKCSSEMARTLARVGFDAICHSRPFPWIKRLPADVPLAGLSPAQWTEEGLPVLPRFSMEASETDIVLRAFLDQPLILLGHHWDAVDNYALFERAAGIVNSLGAVHWMDMTAMAHSNYSWKRKDGLLQVRAYSKQLAVQLPGDVTALEVEVPVLGDGLDSGTIEISGVGSLGVRRNGALHGSAANVADTPCTVRVHHTHSIDPAALTAPGTPMKHLARRVVTELRDRCQPLTGR